jgi:hypothetical protein
MCNNRCAGKVTTVSANRKMSNIFLPLCKSTCTLSYPTKGSMIAERWNYQARFYSPRRAMCLHSFRGMLGVLDGRAKTTLRTGVGSMENLMRWRDC